MNKRNQIREANVNDEALSLDDYNSMVDACNRFNASYIDSTTIDYQVDDKNGVQTINSTYQPPAQTHSLFALTPSKLGCSIGKCIRNSFEVELEPAEDYEDENWAVLPLTEFTTNGSPNLDSIDYYVYLEFDNTDVDPTPSPEYEPQVFPFQVLLKADSSRSYVGIKDPSSSPDVSEAISSKRRILGVVTLAHASDTTYLIDKIVQAESQKGDWISNYYMLDTENTLPASEGRGESIEVNTRNDTPYCGKLQLKDFSEVANVASETTNTKIENDDIQWTTDDFITDDTAYVLIAVKGGNPQQVTYLYPTEMQVVTNVEWDNANHKLVQTKTPAYVLGYNTNEEVESDITIASECPSP